MRKVFKYLSYAVVYLIISIASAYGVITLSTSYAGRQARGNGSDESSTLPSQLTSIIENFSNSSYLSFNLNTNIDYQDESFEITINGELDMSKGFENISFGGNVNALIVNSDISYDMNFIYNNGKTYVDILNGKMTIETTSVFNSITQILNLLDVKIPELGFDMSSFDISSMMGIFSNLEENVLKNGNYEIKIALPTEKYLILICDKDYKVLSLNFDYATEEFSVAVNGNLNYPTTSSIPTPNDEEYINVGNLLDVTESAIRYAKDLTNPAYEINLDYNDMSVKGQLFVNPNAQTAMFTMIIDENTLNLIYLNNCIFVEYGEVYVKFELKDIDKVDELLNNQLNVKLPIEEITNLIDDLKNGKFLDSISGVDFSTLLNKDLNSIDLSVIEKVYVEGDKTFIDIKNIGQVGLGQNNKILNFISFSNNEVKLSLKVIDFKDFSLIASTDSYINLVVMLPTINNALDILKSTTISGSIAVKYGEFSLPVEFIAVTSNDYYKLATTIEDKDFTIEKLNNKIYLNLAETFKCVVNLDTFSDELIKFISEINYDLHLKEISEIIDKFESIISSEQNLALIKSLTQTENGFVITLSNDMVITLGNDEKTILVDTSINGVEISVNVNGTDEILTIPTFNDEEYDKVETLLELVKVIVNSGIIEAIEGGVNYFKNGKAGFEFSATYSGVTVNGTLYADILAKTLTLNANFKGETISLKLLTGVVYLEYNNIFAKFELNDLTLLADFLNKNFALNIPVEKLSALFNAVNSGDIESAFNMISDKLPKEFKLDLDTIDKTFFENITKEGNDLIIPVGDNLVTITTINKLLTAIKFNGYGVDLTANTTQYKETSLASSESGYINLVDLLPTIENALQIFRASTISGNINIKLNELEIPMTFNYTNIDGVYAEFKTSIYNGKIEIHYIGNVIYINLLDQIKLYSDLENLPNALKELTDGLDTLINPILDMVGITSEFINSLKNHDTSALKLAVKQVENNLIITINGTDISLTNGSNELLISSIIKNTTIDARIAENVDGIIKDNIDINEYVPIEQIFRLFNAAKNMSKREDFHVTGYIDLKLGNWSLAGIQFNVYIKVVDKKLQMIIEFPSIPSFPLVISNAGSLTIYYKDGDVYLHRTETVKKKTHVETVKLTTNSLFENILDYVQFGFGFSDLAMSLMQIDMGKYRQGETIDLSNVLSGFAVKELGSQTEYDMTFNLGEIVDNKALSNLSLRTYIGENEMGESYLQELALSTKIADMITISTPVNKDGSDDKEKIIKIVDYGKSIDDKIQELYDYENNYNFPYDTIMEKTGDGDWTIASEVLRTITFVTNSSTSLPNLSGVYNSDITLPSLEMIVVDDDITRSTKTFEGWYTSENFDSDTLFESTKMPKHDTTLYAKWNEEILRYSTITFVTNSDINVDSIRLLEGSQFNLPTLSLKQIIAEDGKTVSSYSFAGWSTNEDGNVNFTSSVMPHDDTTLYAIWKLEKVEECSEFKLYDNGELLYSIYLPAGEAIDLTGISKVNESSKFYLDENYVDEFTENLIMPNKNLTLHLRNKYTLIISSEYGNIANTTMEVWQGENINVANQNSYYLDFNSNGNVVEENVMGKHHRTYYNFLGYKINDNEITNDYSIILTNMPNGNYTVESIWETNDVVYYTVNFHADWYKPYGYIDPKVKTEPPKNIPSIEVLDGTTITLEKYIFTCEARPTAISRYKTLYSTTWGTSAWANNTQKRKGQRSFTITQNTDLYACWDDAPTASDLENYNLYKDMNSNIA